MAAFAPYAAPAAQYVIAISVDGLGVGIKRLALGGREATPDDEHVSRTMLVSTMSSRMTLMDGKPLPSMVLRAGK